MNVIPHISVPPAINPLTILPSDQTVVAAPHEPRRKPHAAETLETIEIRATSMSLVLEKIMAYDGGYRHGGLND